MLFITNGGRPVTGTGERRTHLIQPGETLEGIARRHGTTVDAAMRVNPHIRNPDLIFHGTRIALPPGVATPRPPIAPPRPWPAPPRPRPPAVAWPAPPTIAPPRPPVAWPAPPTPRPVPPAYTLPLPPAAARDPRYDNAGGRWPAPPTPVPRWPAPPTPVPRPAQAPGILGGIAGFFGGMAGGVIGFMDGIASFFERLGWSPQIAKLLVWAIVIGAVGKVLTLRIRV